MTPDKIKGYWDERARISRDAATTNDLYLRRLESEVLISHLEEIPLPGEARILDIGCGDGETTAALSRNFPFASFEAIDFSAEMVALARKKAETDRINFSIGDVRVLDEQFAPGSFDVIITNRCLINLPSKQEQYESLRKISSRLAPGGFFLGTENFLGGQEELTRLRRSLDLDEIPIRWHNLYFDEAEFLNETQKFFGDVQLMNFSSAYYLVTRAVYSALCKKEGIEPAYDHPIYEIAARLPAVGDFSPIKLIRARA